MASILFDDMIRVGVIVLRWINEAGARDIMVFNVSDSLMERINADV